MTSQVNLNSGRQRRALGQRILERIRRNRDGIVYHYAPLNGLSEEQIVQGFKETGTPRKCQVQLPNQQYLRTVSFCQEPAVRQRLTQSARGIDRSSRVFVCAGCE